MPAPFAQIHLHHLQGAASRVRAEDTAVGHRDAAYALNIIGMWADPQDSARHVRWVRDCWAAMERFSQGVYVNFLGDEGAALVKAAYDADAYPRLVGLKQTYDPTNLFHLNQNIQP